MKYGIKLHKCPLKFFTLMVCIIALNGCQRYTCWLRTVFNQGVSQKVSLKSAQSYIRSLRIYDQVNTLCNFDILFLDTSVIATLKNFEKYFKDNNAKHEESYENYITFYVLAPTINGLLTDPMSKWHILLEVDHTMFKPVELKAIVLDNQYRFIFNDLFNKYKQAYRVRFNCSEDSGTMLLKSAHQITLHFKKLGKQGSVTWSVNKNMHKSINKDRLAYDISTPV